LQIAERIGLPVVVSSALETSIGIRAGLALAAALPDLPYACGLNTVALLADDLVEEPLIAVDGAMKVGDLAIDEATLESHQPDNQVRRFWQARLVQTRELAGG
jgi:O-succinylbenzoate synthase